MEGDHRRRSNVEVPENVERPSRGPRRRTRDSGAVSPPRPKKQTDEVVRQPDEQPVGPQSQ